MIKGGLLKNKLLILSLSGFFIYFTTAIFVPPLHGSNADIDQAYQALRRNPLLDELVTSDIKEDVFQWERTYTDRSTKVVMDKNIAGRIHLLSETQNGRTMSLRYVYDDMYETVTVLFSSTPKGSEPLFTHYYRYALGPNGSLELILEEGWIGKTHLITSHFYDYYPNSLQVRFFDRTGKLLRIDSSKGCKKSLIYSRDGRLLTVKEESPLGEILFHDQPIDVLKELRPFSPSSSDHDITVFILPDRETGKRLGYSSFKNQDLDFSLGLSKGELVLADYQQRFLEWFMAAHPSRAGPMGGMMI